jgi:hypothetical protein
MLGLQVIVVNLIEPFYGVALSDKSESSTQHAVMLDH